MLPSGLFFCFRNIDDLMVDALSIADSLPPITGTHTLLSIICLSSDTMTFFASFPLVRNASLTLMLAVLLLPISSLCRLITSSTSGVAGAALADLAVVPPTFFMNASSFIRADLVTIRQVGAGALCSSLTSDCTECADCCGAGCVQVCRLGCRLVRSMAPVGMLVV